MLFRSRSKKNVSMETQQHHQHAHAATTQAASKPIDIPGQTHAAATAHAASGPRGLPLGPGPKRLRSGLPTVDSSPAGVGAVRQELLGSASWEVVQVERSGATRCSALM